MEQYIPKSVLVAEINRQIELLNPFLGACAGQMVAEANSKIAAYNRVKDIINVTEVKEVDLEVELANYNSEYVDENGFLNTEHLAKHFFELGLQIAQKGE